MTEKTKEYYREYRKKYYQEHKEYFKNYCKQWRKDNPEKCKKHHTKARNKQAEKLIAQGVINPYSVIVYGYEPKYKEKE